jgi:hypothetical protein
MLEACGRFCQIEMLSSILVHEADQKGIDQLGTAQPFRAGFGKLT